MSPLADGVSIIIDVLKFFLELKQIDSGFDLNQNSVFLEADNLSYVILVNSCFYFDVVTWFEGGAVGERFFPEEVGIDAEFHFHEGADFDIMEGCEWFLESLSVVGLEEDPSWKSIGEAECRVEVVVVDCALLRIDFGGFRFKNFHNQVVLAFVGAVDLVHVVCFYLEKILLETVKLGVTSSGSPSWPIFLVVEGLYSVLFLELFISFNDFMDSSICILAVNVLEKFSGLGIPYFFCFKLSQRW